MGTTPTGSGPARHDARTRWLTVDNLIFFAFWARLQARTANWPIARQWALFTPFCVLGLGARIWAQTKLRNYDFESYLIVSSTALSGDNPYATDRYNYGPVWFTTLALLRSIAQEPGTFRLALALFLGAVDIALAVILMRRGYLPAACVLLLSPVSIAISGQHQQFDNLAIALAFTAALLMPPDGDRPITRRDWGVVTLLSLSLMTKHIFIVFPIWLAMRQMHFSRAALYLIAPVAIFGLSLLPFALIDFPAVMANVISYQSFNNAPLLNTLFPTPFTDTLIDLGYGVGVFLVVLTAVGLLYRRIPPFESALIYVIGVVVFSSAVADQYLAIPMAAVAALLNLGLLIWLAEAAIYLAGNPATLDLWGFARIHPLLTPDYLSAYRLLFVPLFVGWILATIWVRRKSVDEGQPVLTGPATLPDPGPAGRGEA